MKRYKSFISERLYEDYLMEGVLHPETYLSILIDKMNDLKNKIINQNHSSKYICDFLTNEFKFDKINFIFRPSTINSKKDAIDKASYNVDTEDINIYCNFNLEKIQYGIEDFENFKSDFEELVGHELIHRLQFVNNKDKVAQTISLETNGLIKYLSNVQEIMTHAWQTSQAIKLLGFDKESLSKFLSIDKLVRKIYTLSLYKNNFDKNSPVLKRFYKYLYMYFD